VTYRALSAALLLAATAIAAPARADFVIAIEDVTIDLSVADTAKVSVLISSTDPDDNPLANFGFETRLSGDLQFVVPQGESQLTDPNYVFFGDSSDLINGDPVGVVSSMGGTNNRYVGGDFTNSGADVIVTGSKLLLQLDVRAFTEGMFTLSLLASPFSSFQDAAGNAFPFTTTGGTINVIRSNPIPEPASVVLAGLGVLPLAGLALARRRSRSRATAGR